MHRKRDRATAQVALYFNDDARSQLRVIKEASRRGPPINDWRRVFDELELSAWVYDQGIKSLCDRDRDLTPLAPREVLDALIEHRKAIDQLLRELQDPRLWNWFFVSGDWLWAKGESPLKHLPPSLVESLAAHRDQVANEIGQLKQFIQERRTQAVTADDYKHMFLTMVIDIAHEIFGPEVGGEEGPLIQFVARASQEVLEGSTPPPETLRTIARRHQGGGQPRI
jgi:hypothetical protein